MPRLATTLVCAGFATGLVTAAAFAALADDPVATRQAVSPLPAAAAPAR